MPAAPTTDEWKKTINDFLALANQKMSPLAKIRVIGAAMSLIALTSEHKAIPAEAFADLTDEVRAGLIAGFATIVMLSAQK